MAKVVGIYAEKYDIGLKIACALSGGIIRKGSTITMKNVEAMKDKLSDIKSAGHISFPNGAWTVDVTWGQGHMAELKQAQDYNPDYAKWSNLPMPFIPAKYQIKEKPEKYVQKQLSVIRSVLQSADYVVVATDDDREGELIWSYVAELCKYNKPAKRIFLSSMTEAGIKDAFAHAVPYSTRTGVEAAGRCRAIADWVVGANLTAAATLKYRPYAPSLKTLSFGRVQTPVLDMVVEREKAIKNFVSKPFWTVEGAFTTTRGETYKGKLINGKDDGRFENKSEADIIFAQLINQPGIISSVEKKSFKKQVPTLYNLVDLQIEANEIYGLKAATTLSIVQSLYEKGAVSYPRTESRHLTDDMKDQVNNTLAMLSTMTTEYAGYINQVPPAMRNYTKRHFDSTKVDSHYAIIPTGERPSFANENEAKIYDLLARSLIRIIFKDATAERTTIITSVKKYDFKSSGTVVKDPQWMQVKSNKKSGDVLLPDVAEREQVSGSYEIKDGKTEPPKRYTEATLLTAMKTASKSIDDEALKKALETKNKGGIGRPSTQSSIISTVTQRYCTFKGKSIIPTEDAMRMIDLFPVNDLKSPEMTADWEMKLDAVENNQLSAAQFINDIHAALGVWVAQIDADKPNIDPTSINPVSRLVCPACGKPVRKGKFGYFCTGRTEGCRFAVNSKIAGKKISDETALKLIKDGKTNKLKGFKSKEGKSFSARLVVENDGKVSFSWD